jgi:hypothetical protein
MPSPACTDTAVAGNVLLGVDLGIAERGLGRAQRKIRGELVGACDPALVDAGALHDPLVRGIDGLRELGIGEHAVRQITAAAEHDRTHDAHDAAPAADDGPAAAWYASSCPILVSNS